MNLHCVLFMAGHFGGIPLEVFGCILEANLISINMARRQLTKAYNDDGVQCDACRRYVTRHVHELHTPGPFVGLRAECFELAAHVDDVVAVF